MAYDNRPNLSCKQFDQQGCDYLYLAGHNCVCGTGGTISSNSGYKISGQTIFNATGIGLPSAIRIGHNANNQGESSIAVGFGAQACCMCSVVIGCNNISCSCGGNIIGGYGNLICSGNTNSTLVGVNNCTINANCYTNSVIVPNLVILSTPSGSGNVLGWDSSTKKVCLTTGGSGTASGENLTKLINQTSHGFNVNCVVGWSSGAYSLPTADGTYNGEVLGIVSKCYNANCFELSQAGFVSGLTGLVTNTTYFLSPTVAGQLTAIEPSGATQISKAVLIATSSSSAWVLPYPGYVISTGATPGGGGTITGATNGLSVTGKKIKLGGTLTGDTTINANSKDFCVYGAKSVMLQSICVGQSSTLYGYNSYLCGSNFALFCSPQVSINFDTSGYVYDNAGTPRGLRYGGNYRANFLCDSFVDAAYVTGKTSTAGTITGATNLGSGNGRIYTSTLSKNLQLKSLSGGTNVTLTCNGNYIAINAGGSGPAFGWSNLAMGSTVAGCGTQASGGTLTCNTYYGVSAGTKTTSGANNVAIGNCALRTNLIGNYNVAVGACALRSNTSIQNTAVGALALQANTAWDNTAVGIATLCTAGAGYGNTALGAFSLAGITSGYNNVGVGYQIGYCMTTGYNNIGMGYQTLYCNISGNNNIGIGDSTLYCNSGSTNNTAIGCQSMYHNRSGTGNVAIGNCTIHSNISGSQNIGLGTTALYANTTGAYNIALGFQTLSTNDIGSCNIGIGLQAMISNTSGNENVAIGANALIGNTTGCANVALGTNSLRCNKTGNCNVAIGRDASYNNTGGTCNVAVGSQALYCNTCGGTNVANGYQALFGNKCGNGNVASGSQAMFSNVCGCYNAAFGASSLYLNTTGNQNIAVGYQSMFSNTSGCDNVAVGSYVLATNSKGHCNIALGYQAMYYNISGCTNIGIGYRALNKNTIGNDNIAVGQQALICNTTGYNNIGLGYLSLYLNTIGTHNIAIGSEALRQNTGGTFNTAIGYQALYNNCCGIYNIAIGCHAMYENTTGVANIALGFEALNHNCSGCANIAIGFESQFCRNSGIYNVSFGNQALYCNYTGNYNTAIGDCALMRNTGGTSNTALGFYAGCGNASGSRNLFLGSCAGMSETGSDKLHIANCHSCTLICGDFSAKTIKIDGCICATCAIQPASGADAGFPNNSIYYSTTQNKLVYKDSGGTVNTLY